ncbi:deubiquitination-protection protein dph1 [Trichoderma asperellum]|uniref:Deubiquitination-protection protein dph1 n=1 Tax=Trichoderma asperellum TaxID=101201 RepID=A0A6V8QW03_TRIAP|nr:deubiquitination-protection protein dph1 [Trichoderma asperellum]
MADNAEAGSDAQITFRVKTSQDGTHTITMAESATVLDLKTKLSTAEFENIPVDRQRLIYSGRVMKNDDTLATYKIKPNNTIHMVKSAASNPSQPASASTPTPAAVPTNMASGTANNPLAGLTGARYAGHQINLPGMDMFGPDGGMGPPMDEERLQRMMSDPNVQQSMNEALNNPDFINMLIESNPMLRNIPNARELINSPFMRQMMSNPQMMTQALRMQRNMGRPESAFPAPGATDTTPADAPAADGTAGQGNNQQQNPFANPFMMPGLMGGAGGMPNLQQMQQMLQNLNAMTGGGAFPPPPSGNQTGAAAGTTGQQPAAENRGTGGDAGAAQTQGAAAANPFAALFPPPAAEGANPFALSPEQFQQMMQVFAPQAAPSPPDNRPPEERYAEQLRQLNDMGFYDFDRNVAALRRSGGSVQGAVEHLLGGGN